MSGFQRAALVLGAVATAVSSYAMAAPSAPIWSWLATPTREDWAALSPEAASDPAQVARVILRCHVEDDGALNLCEVVHEAPAGLGFGKAALALSAKFRRVSPQSPDQRQIDVPLQWVTADTAPDWLRKPTADQVLGVFPTEAAKQGREGSAVINCAVTVQGALGDCVTIRETPAGAGFGAAAIALTPQFLMKPALFQGRPVRSFVSLPVNFKFPQGGMGSALSKRLLPPDIGWLEAPSYADVVAAYPKRARADRKAGHAMLACDLTSEGRLTECQVVRSEPSGYGFDSAAKVLARQFRVDVGSGPDSAKATRTIMVHLPVTFDPAMLDAATPVVGKPKWSALPSAEATRAAFGEIATTETARVMLRCLVQQGGALTGCSVESESPPGAGVGKAALALSTTFRLSTWTIEGLPTVGGSVRIPLRYESGPASESADGTPRK